MWREGCIQDKKSAATWASAESNLKMLQKMSVTKLKAFHPHLLHSVSSWWHGFGLDNDSFQRHDRGEPARDTKWGEHLSLQNWGKSQIYRSPVCPRVRLFIHVLAFNSLRCFRSLSSWKLSCIITQILRFLPGCLSAIHTIEQVELKTYFSVSLSEFCATTPHSCP